MTEAKMNPGAQEFIEKMRAAAPTPLWKMTAPEARVEFMARVNRLLAPPLSPCDTEDRTISQNGLSVPVRIYRPEAGEPPLSVIVYFHGGGWVVGDLEMVDPLCHDICAQSGAVVVSVDYRLAPEHPFPAAIDDATAVIAWVRENTDALGVDPDALFVAGDSAGGNMAAVTALVEAEAGRKLAGQVLIYPVTDISQTHPSMSRFSKGLNLDQATMEWFDDCYYPDKDTRTDWRVSPLAAPLPAVPAPALVITAGYDPLCDEGEAYADHLAAAGVPTEYVCFSTQIHGFANQPKLSNDPYVLRDLVARFVRRYSTMSDRISS